MKKKLFSTLFLTAIIISVIILLTAVHFTTAQNSTYVVSGYVFDPSGKLVSGASVYLVNSTGHGVGSGLLTGPSGYYYAVAPAGTYWLVANGPSGSNLSYSMANLVVNSDFSRNVTLVSGFKISGYVLDSSGKGIAGVPTDIYNASWSVPSVNTDSSGFYSVSAPAGTYTFIVWPPYNTNIVNYDNPAFVVNSDLTNNITLASGFKVSGYVLYPSGIAVSGITTYLTNSTGWVFNSGWWSDSSGYYFDSAPAGIYTLTARGLSGSGLSYSAANVVVNSDVTKNIILSTVSISPSSATMDMGQTQLFSAVASGGSGSYTLYQWYVNGSIASVQTNSTFNYSPASSASYLITAIATDSAGATSSQSTVAAITVNSALAAPTVSVSKSAVDQGQTSSLTSSFAMTGTPPYSYQWLMKAPGASSYSAIIAANGPSYSFVTSNSTAVGVWNFELNVTDGASTPVTVASAASFVTVNLSPTVSVSPGVATLDVGSSKMFIANSSGGSGSLSFQWFLDGAFIGSNSTSYSYVASMGSHYIYVNVTDSANPPTWAASNIVSITVNPALVAPIVSASTAAIDQGQTSNLTSTTAINGTSPYSLQWIVKAPGTGSFSAISGATGPSYSFVTSGSTAVGVWSFELNVTDGASTPVTVTTSVTSVMANIVPTVFISPGTAAFDVGHSQFFTANPTGGSNNYIAYQWFVNGSFKSGQSGSTFNFTSATLGSFSVTATVTDSLGVTSPQSSNATISVNPTLVAPILTTVSVVVDQGSTSVLTTSVTTGTPSYVYQWYSKAPNAGTYSLISSGASPSYNFVTSNSNTVGVWSFEVQVTDAMGEVVNSSKVSVTVNIALTVSVSPASTTLNVGQSQLFTATANGGSGTYTGYQWYVDAVSQPGQSASTFSYSPTSVGYHSITATVSDSLGSTSVQSSAASATASITPTPTPTASPTPTLSPTPTTTASPSPIVPEFPAQMSGIVLVAFVMIALFMIMIKKNKRIT